MAVHVDEQRLHASHATYSARRYSSSPGARTAQLAQGARLELADTLAGDPKARADLLERLGPVAGEPEAALEHVAHARVQAGQSARRARRSGACRP